MRIETQLLTLAQWLSPAYPLGSFAWSHGLETAVARGWVHDAESLQAWLGDVLLDGSGRSDAVFLRLAAEAEGSALVALNARALAFAPSRERRAETVCQGAAFVRTTNAVWGLDLPELALPLAVGRASRLMSMDVELVVPLYLQGFAANLAAAAQRLMPLGQSRAQAVVAALAPLCEEVAERTRDASEDALYSTAFLSDIAAMTHETQHSRLFQS